MDKIKNTPEIRFDGFEDQWNHFTLSDLGEVKSCKRIYKNQTSASGEIPFYKIGTFGAKADAYIDKSTYDYYKKNFSYPKIDEILISASGTLGRTVKYQGEKAYFQDSNIVWLSITNERLTNDFLFEFYKQTNWGKVEGSTIKRLYNKDILSKEIAIPSTKEQTSISNLFKNLDEKLELEKAKHQKLINFKKAMLEDMFPKEGDTVPKIRFDGFEGEWEESLLGNQCIINTGKLDANAMVEGGKYDFYTSGIKTYKIDSYSFHGPAITVAGNGATVGYMHLADGLFDAYQRTYVLSNIEIDRVFAFHTIQNNLVDKIKKESRTGNIPYIVMNMLTKLPILIPSNKEQVEIGRFFTNLDNKIMTSKKKIKKIENFKKSLMDKMFV